MPNSPPPPLRLEHPISFTVFNAVETCLDKEAVVISDLEENIIFQCTYKETIGCKTSTIHDHGYMSTRPTERESMKAQLEEQARATDAANQKKYRATRRD